MALVVFTGGARSGKSAAAQGLALERHRHGATVLVAVFGQTLGDEEMGERIERHRTQRPVGFHTLEAVDGASWMSDVPDAALLVVDCLGTLLARIMDEVLDSEIDLDSAEEVERRLDRVLEWLVARSGDTIVVTNEVGDGVVPAYPSGRVFRDLLGRANRTLVGAAVRAFLVTCGRMQDLSALPADPTWPHD